MEQRDEMTSESLSGSKSRRRRLAVGALAVAVGALGSAGVTGLTTHHDASAQSSPSGLSLPQSANSSNVNPATAVQDGLIVTTGEGQVRTQPTALTADLQVQTSGPHVQDALGANDRAVSKVRGALHDEGIADLDIDTSQLSINGTYAANGAYPGNAAPYTASQNVTVHLHDLSKAGAVVDNAVATVGDAVRVNYLSYSVDDKAVVAQARRDAVAAARAQANDMAAAAGVGLGAVRSVVDSSSTPFQPLPMTSRAPAAAASTQVSPGAQTVSVQVQVAFEIKH